MENKFSRSYFGSPFCGPRYIQHRNTSTMCLFGDNGTTEMENLWKNPEAPPETLIFDLLDTTKKEPPESSRITIIKAACVPLFNSVCEFFRKNLPALTPAPKQDCPDFSNSYNIGLVTATLPPRSMEHNRMAGDLVDLSNYTVIHREEVKASPLKETTTKSDLNCKCPPKTKMPTRRQRKNCQNTQNSSSSSRRGKHAKEKMRKKIVWDMREDMHTDDDIEDEFEDVLAQEISSSIEESTSSQSPHTSDYVCDFIASIPSSEPRKMSPCAFVKKLPAVLRMDIPFSPRKQHGSDSDDSFIVFESPKGESICDRIAKFRSCERRRKLSEESDDSFVIFADDTKEDDDTDEADSDTSDSDIESEPIQLDSGFEERKVRFNLKPEIHVIKAWDFAYRQARKGNWDQVARDRDRFEKRILSLGHVLSPILELGHRAKIFDERFRRD